MHYGQTQLILYIIFHFVVCVFTAAAGAIFPENIVEHMEHLYYLRFFYSGHRCVPPSEYGKKREAYESSCMYVSTQVDFRSLFKQTRNNK